MNPLISMMQNNTGNNTNARNPLAMMQQFNQFRQMWNPQMAQAKIQEMLNSGQITPEQLRQAEMMANNFKTFMR